MNIGIHIGITSSRLLDEALGAELAASFTNGSVAPLNTLVTADDDISSGIATAGATGCASTDSFAVVVGEVMRLEIDGLNISAATLNGLSISIAASGAGDAADLSNVLTYSTVQDEGAISEDLTIVTDDPTAYLQLRSADGSTVSFDALNISLKSTDLRIKALNPDGSLMKNPDGSQVYFP